MKMNTSSANLQAVKAAKCSNANSQAAKCGKAYSLPVSKKFYVRIRERVLSVLGALGIATDLTDDYCADVMRLIDRHLAGDMATVSPEACRHGESRVIFLALRDEIDMAVKRSRRAREAASRRRCAAQSGVPPVIESPEVAIPEATPVNGNDVPETASCTPVAPFPGPSWRRAGRPNLKKRLKTRYRPR